MSSNLSINTDNLTTSAPLYTSYPGQAQAQDAYVTLDEDGLVSTWVNGNVGPGLPEAMWNGRVQIWRVPSDVEGACLADMLQGEAAPLLQSIYDGFSVVWNGSNHVGKLNEDAQEASEELERLLEGLEDCRASVWDIGEWLGMTSPDDLIEEGVSLDDQVAKYLETARRDDVVLDGDDSDLRSYILDRLEESFRDEEDLPAHLSALLLAEGRVTKEEIDERAEEDASDSD